MLLNFHHTLTNTWLLSIVTACFEFSIYVSDFRQRTVSILSPIVGSAPNSYSWAHVQSIWCIRRLTFSMLCVPYLCTTNTSFLEILIVELFKKISISILDRRPLMLPCTESRSCTPSLLRASYKIFTKIRSLSNGHPAAYLNMSSVVHRYLLIDHGKKTLYGLIRRQDTCWMNRISATIRKVWISTSLLVNSIVISRCQNGLRKAFFLWGHRLKQSGQYGSPVYLTYFRAQFWYGPNSHYLIALSAPDGTTVSSWASNNKIIFIFSRLRWCCDSLTLCISCG